MRNGYSTDEWVLIPHTDGLSVSQNSSSHRSTFSTSPSLPSQTPRPWRATKIFTSETKRLRLQRPAMPNAEMLEVIFMPMDEQDFNKTIRDPGSLGIAGPKSGVRDGGR